jgi:hypothetical protein
MHAGVSFSYSPISLLLRQPLSIKKSYAGAIQLHRSRIGVGRGTEEVAVVLHVESQRSRDGVGRGIDGVAHIYGGLQRVERVGEGLRQRW